VFFSQVVSVANVSHLAQPAILTSHNFIRRAGRHLQPSAEPYPVYSAAAYFHDKGYRTLMVSSQDENWLDMDSIILAQPWDSIAEASRLPRNDPSLYEDACGTHKVRDSRTVRRFADELAAALRDGPAFGYLNLQNTHYPYVLEHEPPLPMLPAFSCADLQDFPAQRLPEAIKREQLTLLNTERRLAKLVQQFPDAMFAFVGDHGEHLVAGRRFAHSKSAVPAEIDTFLFLLNSGLPPTRVDEPISTLDVLPTLMGRVDAADVGRIPRGMLAGRDVLAGDRFHRSGPLVTTSSGLGEPSFVLRSGPVAYELLSDSERCTRNGAAIPSQTPECRDAAVAVERWLSCTVRFEELARSGRLKGFFNPCVLR
jgi:hypothetical protein